MTKRQRTHREENKLQTWRCPRWNLCNVLLGPGSPHTEYKCPTFGIAVHIKFHQAFLLRFIFSLNWTWTLWLIGKAHSFLQHIIYLVIFIKLKVFNNFCFSTHEPACFFLHIWGTNMADSISVWIFILMCFTWVRIVYSPPVQMFCIFHKNTRFLSATIRRFINASQPGSQKQFLTNYTRQKNTFFLVWKSFLCLENILGRNIVFHLISDIDFTLWSSHLNLIAWENFLRLLWYI